MRDNLSTETPTQVPWRANLVLGYDRSGASTRLIRREHSGPLRVQKAFYPEGEAVCHTIVVHPPGGIVSGDELAIDVVASGGAHALLTTPGAAKWYRSTGKPARQHVRLLAAEGARLEWLPQEAIFYDNADAHLKRQIMGREVVVAITKGKLDLGPWEQIYYGEFDGRRRKRVLVKIIGE